MLLMDIRKSINCKKYSILVIGLLAAAVFWSAGCSGNIERPISFSNVKYSPSAAAVNINTASADELQKIPHIGEKIAGQIIEHRERYGPFRRAEDLILIQGISDSRFRKIRSLVRVD
jgi:competence ComEA-like helix-hairpin-helix protein